VDKNKKNIQTEVSPEIKNRKFDLKEFMRKAKAARSTFTDEDLSRLESSSTAQ